MEKVLNPILYILGIILTVLILIFKDNLFVVLCILTAYMIVFGIIWILLKQKIGSISLSVGISVLVAIILNKNKFLVVSDSITFAICLSLILVLGLTFLINYFTRKNILRTHTIVLEAEVIDLVANPNSKKEMYLPIYSYKIGRDIYEVEYFRFYEKNIPTIGSKKTLRVNPHNHVDVFFDQETQNKVFNICCYICLIVVCLYIIIGLF